MAYFVFDAYGTLFDVHSAVSRYANDVGPNAARVSEIWRTKQLEYTWTRAAMGRYKNFWQLTEDALDFALNFVPNTNKAMKHDLLEAYLTLDCYSEVISVLEMLQKSGTKTAILSNGTPNMLQNAIASASLGELLDNVFSVDAISTYKTMPTTYQMVIDAWQIRPEQIQFQSSNRWDIAGAKAFGFKCNWINRTNQPNEYEDLQPDRILNDLVGLLN